MKTVKKASILPRCWQAVVLAAALLAAPLALAEDPRALVEQANAAYTNKNFAASAELFVKAISAGASAITNHYNAACAFALNGDTEQAFQQLQSSIDAGLGGPTSPRRDPDFVSLHGDPRWAPLLARYESANPGIKLLDLVQDQKRTTASRYFAGRKGLNDGVVSGSDKSSPFNQHYANMAQFVGEYDEASRIYGNPTSGPGGDAIARGYVHASAANAVVLQKSRGRQAVFLNESHGQSQTRAANYSLLAPLRAQGFKYLAIETLATTDYAKPSGSRCSNTSLSDKELMTRGYPTQATGYYTQDPVFAEIIREALRLGYVLVAYDTKLADRTVAAREQNEADNLACVFKDDPAARLVVIAGFSHIAEKKDFWVPGGAMAYRFKALTGIDPLTVDTTTQLGLDPAELVMAAPAKPGSGEAFILANAAGDVFSTDNFDVAVYVPAPAHRNDGVGSWLELGGVRKPNTVTAGQCQGRLPCLVQARRKGEQAEAVASDRCVIKTASAGCTLYLRQGRYEVSSFDEQEALIETVTTTVD